MTYIIQHHTHEDVEGNAEEVHDGASSLLRNVLGPHLHYGRPKYTNTGLKSTEAKQLNTACERDASTFLT